MDRLFYLQFSFIIEERLFYVKRCRLIFKIRGRSTPRLRPRMQTPISVIFAFPQMREENDLTYGAAVSQEHDQTIHPHSKSPIWWHAVSHRP